MIRRARPASGPAILNSRGAEPTWVSGPSGLFRTAVAAMAQYPSRRDVPTRQLSLFDSVSIIVGIIIGAGIYETTPMIAQNVPDPWWLIGAWLLGGVLSLLGALCYAELATSYPHAGGDYVYLNRAYGGSVGFLFAWAQLWVVRPGSIGAMGYVFARYANELLPLGGHALVIYASLAVLILTAVNILGVPQGKWTQNVLTSAKVLGLLAIFGVAFLFPSHSPPEAVVPRSAGPFQGSFALAMIFVLFTYGGWNEMALVGAELRDPERNVLRALLLGTGAVTLIYVLVNLAFLYALGFHGTRSAQAVAADLLALKFQYWGRAAISVLVSISALGAINGQILTGARIYYAMGRDHRLYAPLGKWSPRLGTPVYSLLVQAVITLVLVIAFGLSEDGFQSMVKFTTPVFWFFFLLTGLSLFLLRRKQPHVVRPYSVHWYPATPIVFCISSACMLYFTLAYAVQQTSYEPLWAVAIVALGCLLCFRRDRPEG